MKKISTPVAFFIFNRPEVTQKVFEEISKVCPPVLLIIADGPREDRAGEDYLCTVTRQIIDSINWECKVLTNFSIKNLGCKNRISSGIDWVFEHVEEAIILEDDCLPNPSFFWYCEELLRRYRDNPQVGMISGNNFISDKLTIQDSYYFSRYPHIWGWATWRRAWINYDVNLRRWKNVRKTNWLKNIFCSPSEISFWRKAFNGVSNGKIDTWDYQWAFACFDKGMLSIIPRRNLISNIGFGPNATHTTGDSIFSNMEMHNLNFPLSHPKKIVVNYDADRITASIMYTVSIYRRVMRRFVLPILRELKFSVCKIFSVST